MSADGLIVDAIGVLVDSLVVLRKTSWLEVMDDLVDRGFPTPDDRVVASVGVLVDTFTRRAAGLEAFARGRPPATGSEEFAAYREALRAAGLRPGEPVERRVEFIAEERQAIVLALAELAARRPGWCLYLQAIASKFAAGSVFEDLRVIAQGRLERLQSALDDGLGTRTVSSCSECGGRGDSGGWAPVRCSSCGSRRAPNVLDILEPSSCESCKGTGWFDEPLSNECPDCQGTGWKPNPEA